MTTTDLYWDMFDPQIAQDPYPIYRRLRAEAPVYFNEQHNFYAVSRWSDIERGLPDAEAFSSARGNVYEFIAAGFEMPPGTLIFEDPPLHNSHRALVSQIFAPKAVADLEPAIRAFVAQQLDTVRDANSFDVVKVLSDKVPMRVIGMLMGIPEDEQQAVRDQTVANLRTEEGGQMDADLANIDGNLFSDYIDWRMEHPSDDIMTKLLTLEFEDIDGTRRTLTKDEILVYCAVVAGAGNETTGQLIGWMAKTFGEEKNHAQYAELVADPSLIPNAVEEIIRLEPIGHAVGRYATRDVEFDGQVIPAGSTTMFLLGSATHDESVYEDPDELNIHRSIRQQRAFGYGLHYCLGASLARLEGRIALEELVKALPNGWDVDWSGAKLASTSTVRGWESMPIVRR